MAKRRNNSEVHPDLSQCHDNSLRESKELAYSRLLRVQPLIWAVVRKGSGAGDLLATIVR